METQPTARLKTLIDKTFDAEEFEMDLCFPFDLSPANLRGDILERKVWSLIHHFQSRGELDKLLDTILKARSSLAPEIESIRHELISQQQKTPLQVFKKKPVPIMITGVIILVLLAIAVVVFQSVFNNSSTNSSTPIPTSSSSGAFQLLIQDSVTGNPIKNVKVTLHIGGIAPLTDFTDDNGNSLLLIDSMFDGEPAQITIEADGYEQQELNINLQLDSSPLPIRLIPSSS